MSNDYILPGGYSEVIEVYNGINVSSPVRILVLIGSGKDYYEVKESVVRDDSGLVDYALHPIDTIIKVTDKTGIKVYVEGTHYQKSADNGIEWLNNGSVASIKGSVAITSAIDLDGKTLIVETNTGSETVNFSGSLDLSGIVSAINGSGVSGFTAEASGDYLLLKSVDTGDGAYIKILNGTANDDLGLVENSVEYGFGLPVVNTEYVVEYQYKKTDDDYVLKEFYNMDSWYEEYGYPVKNGVISKMGIAGYFVFSQLPNVKIYGIQTKGDTKYDYYEAIDKLANENFTGIPLLVPLSTDTDVFTYLKNHCDAMATFEERKERTGLVGAADSKFVYDFLDVELGTSTSKELTGEYVAVLTAVEKLKVSDLARTITFKVIDYIQNGVQYSDKDTIKTIASGLNNKNIEFVALVKGSYYELKDVAKAGVTILEKNYNGVGFIIRHNITTRAWSGVVAPPIYESEPTAVVVRYYVAKVLRETLIARHGGEKITNALLKSIELTTNLVMEKFVNLELISDYDGKNIVASQDPNNPIVVEVTVPAIKTIYNNLITIAKAVFIL